MPLSKESMLLEHVGQHKLHRPWQIHYLPLPLRKTVGYIPYIKGKWEDSPIKCKHMPTKYKQLVLLSPSKRYRNALVRSLRKEWPHVSWMPHELYPHTRYRVIEPEYRDYVRDWLAFLQPDTEDNPRSSKPPRYLEYKGFIIPTRLPVSLTLLMRSHIDSLRGTNPGPTRVPDQVGACTKCTFFGYSKYFCELSH